MEYSLAEGLMFGISPLLVVLFALELSATEWLYNKNDITHRGMSVRVAFSVFKLPLSIVLPAVCDYIDAQFGNIVLVLFLVVDFASLVYVMSIAARHDSELRK